MNSPQPRAATRAGFVCIAGKPNAGKSTLLNRLIGHKLGIVSPKPQSTRDRVVGIVTRDRVQMVVLDTPGLLDPGYPLQEAMRDTARAALADADVIIYLVDASEEFISPLHEAAGLARVPVAPVLTALNKVDRLGRKEHERLRAQHAAPDTHLISALSGEGVDQLVSHAAELLPESPFLYPEDDISTQSQRFFVTELIRETVFEQLEQELPYSLACEIEEFRESSSPVYIRAVLYVERPSQKSIIIGSKGARIREIGRVARRKAETFLEERVYLDLWVKVLRDWRKDPRLLKRFGYNMPGGDQK